ncbi:phage tail length tape measure family protein [Stenotrophomonas maltophilia group sp. Smal13]|uniref:phage tail length tape measure family protein n=1 Tax=Stenotrophomonas maltophilia group sp. Smal13 TaxID=3377166 RepID=UPI002554039C|nr:phage tail length tape measure family protein [Stenotrophomonas maltophilia]
MDIAELGYKVDSSGLVEGTKALDENAAAADRAGGAADRLDREYSALARTVERSSSALGDRLGGALDRIGTGTGAVITELQTLNRTNAEILASLGALDGKLASTAAQAQAYGAAGAAAAASTAQVATASQQLEKQLADQDARLKGVAQRAMEWAASNREANLSERALAEAARDAALGIDHKARALAGAGSEQDRMVARARALEEAEARAANEVRQAAAAAEAQQINLKQLLGQIDPTVGALNRLASMEERLERAHKAGLVNPAIFDQYQNKIDAMRASVLNATGAQNGMGQSAKQLQNNLRMIPMQVTDITTSLVSGQPAWMVAIQQGGQLKDQFGGIGPAARAVGGYVLGLINPLTLAAAALAALTIAAKQSEDQLFDFQKAQILSGQASSVGAAGFLELASSIDQLQGVSRSGAVAALTETAKAGRFAGEQFEMVAAAAARMEASTGRSAQETIRAFESIAKEPVDGLLKLNDAERFLTAAQLQRIVALKEEGRMQQAASEAMQIFAAHLNDVADRTEAVMPEMSKGWRGIKDDISGAWGALGSFTSAVVDLAGEWGVLARLPRLSDVLGLGVAGGSLVKWAGLPSLSKALNDAAAAMRGLPPLPKPIDEGGALDPQTARDLAAVTQERATAEQAAAEAINAQVAGLDRASAREAARLKIIAQYNKLADNDARHFDGSMQRLIAKAQADVDKSFNRRDGVGKRNGDDSAAQNMLAAAQRQIEANKQLVETGVKVTESERQAMAIEQVLAKGKNTMTASTRALLTAAREELLASGQKAAAYTKEKEAAEALARQQAILAQASSNRARSNELDLMGMGRGSDAVGMLRRQLDIQREYQDELKRIGSQDVAKDKEAWALMAANAAAYRDSELAKERTFQEQRLAMLSDWRAGVQRAWEDYSFAASNALEQANSVMNTALSSWEDAWVRLAQTGKLSFRDMANAIIADLARIAAKQAAVGLINAVASAWGGGVTAAGNAAATSGTQSINEGLLAGYGGGRARGGPVSGSTLYEVGEGGKPELFNDGRGRTYLIPGNDGQVIPAAPAAAAGAGPAGGASVINVNVVVNSDGTTETDADTSLMNQFGKELGQFVDMKIRDAQVKSMKPGGVLHSMGAGR